MGEFVTSVRALSSAQTLAIRSPLSVLPVLWLPEALLPKIALNIYTDPVALIFNSYSGQLLTMTSRRKYDFL